MLLNNKMDKLKKLKTLQNSRQKRIRNNIQVESDNEEEIHSPKKQRKVGQEIIVIKSKLNAGSDVSSDNEESDSDSEEKILFEKLKGSGRKDDTMSDEGHKKNDSSDGDDDVDNNDSDSDTGAEAESDGDDDEDSVVDDDDDDDDDNSDDDELNTIKESGKTKPHKVNKIAPRTEMLQSGKEIDDSEASSSGDEDSGDSSESDSNNSDDEEIMKNGYKRGVVELKTAHVNQKQQLDKKDTSSIGNNKQVERVNHESSEDEESNDSSEDNDEDSNHGDEKVKNIESKNDAHSHSKLKVGSSINKQYEKSSDSNSDSDDESDDDNGLKTNNDEKGVSSSQTSKKHQSYSIVTEDAKREMKESSSDSGSDSSDEGDDSDDDKTDEDDDVKGAATAEHHAENEEVDDEFAAVKKELANVPLEDLMKIKEKLGLKVFNKIMHGDNFEEKKQKVFKRENKNRPMELSSKKRVSVIRHATVAKEKVRRDPRFDDLSGEFQDKHFMKNYSFLSDIKSKEKLLVQKKMDKTKDEDKKKELAKLLNRMNQQEQTEQQKRQRMEMEQQWKEKEKQLVKEGKTPYFLKKSEKKKLELAEKFKELQKSGKVDKYMSKKLKKNAQKEKKKLPGRHQRFM